MTQTSLDLRGLNCPLPVLRIRKAMRTLAKSDRLRAETTDPLAEIDIPNYCREFGHRLIDVERQPDHVVFVIEKGET